MDILPIFVVGLASTILIEICKLFPVLNTDDNKRKAVAFVVSFLVAVLYSTSQIENLGGINPSLFVVGVLSATFTIYKSLIQPVKEVIATIKKALANAGN